MHRFKQTAVVWFKGKQVAVEVDIKIDVVKLAEHLGARAIHNSSGTSSIQGGIIKAYARSARDA